jgi:hypothetical protein
MNKLLGAAAALALVASAGSAMAATDSQTATATASATILNPISVKAPKNMVWGNLVAPSTGTGHFGMTNAGAVTVTDGDGAVLSTGGTKSQAEFTITADNGAAYTAVLNNGTTAVTLTGTSGTLALTLNTVTLPTSGTGSAQTIDVGGSLAVPSGTAGSFSGNIPLTATYQ